MAGSIGRLVQPQGCAVPVERSVAAGLQSCPVGERKPKGGRSVFLTENWPEPGGKTLKPCETARGERRTHDDATARLAGLRREA
jgi:hypothetical protein